jgi:hypothetical protein
LISLPRAAPRGARIPPRRRTARRAALSLPSFLLALILVVLLPGTGRAASDPYLQYWTLETPHFRVHYAKNIERVAERMADVLESVHARLAPALGNVPREVVHVVITDHTDAANGSATALPYDTIRLFVTAPDDMSPLSEFDEWHLELITHEYTHILHTDNIGGLPAILNAVLGKTFAPNQVQPRWVLEGLAVLEESEHTTGGRNRSSIFDMYLRADVIEGRLATLDQITHSPRRWPMGNFWYLYGSRFLTWIAEVYGDHTMRTIAADYGRQLIPYGLNRSIKVATGQTYDARDDRSGSLFQGWQAHLRRLYDEQLQEAAGLPGGLREGTRLTHHGRITQRPRWIPDVARRDPAIPEVLYFLDDGHHRTGFHRMPVVSPTEAWESDRDLFIRAQGDGSASFDREGNVYFSSTETHKRVYNLTDISRLAAGATSESGDEPERVRLTEGLRAIDPDVRPDGRQITYAVNRRGTQYLSVADVLPGGALSEGRVLVPSAEFQQAYTPRFSPDGRKIAYSSWSRGGYRDIRLVDAKSGGFEELTHDRALDIQPAWSADQKTLFFVSDRTGIPNVYAMDLETRELWMVTNVRTGAFMPEPSPDGRTLLYVGYTADGFDLFSMPIDRALWRKAQPYVVNRPDPHPPAPRTAWPRHRYDPFPSLRPRAWSAEFGPGTFGETLVVTTQGHDAVGFHGVSLSVAVDTRNAGPQFSAAYSYGRLPVDFTATLFRSLSPRADYRVAGTTPRYLEEYLGLSSTLSYSIHRAFDSFAFQVGYTASRAKGDLPVGPLLNPQEEITLDPEGAGYLGVLRGAFGYSNLERYLYSVGPARGTSFQLTSELSSKEVASQYDFYSFGYGLDRYVQMPWHPDHTFVVHGQSAYLGGSYPRRGAYYVGGLVDLPPLDAFQNNFFQGGFVLRGYPPYAFAGRQYHLASFEYRFPFWHPERGLSTLPGFLNRVSGVLFLDYGGAFETLDVEKWREQFHTGMGTEVLVDATIGYFFQLTGRFGYAFGTSAEAYPAGKWYFVLATPY